MLFIMNLRTSSTERGTSKTKISVDLDIDGTGKFDVECDIQFLKHITETWPGTPGLI